MASVPIPVADPVMMAWLDTSDWGNAKRLVTIACGKLKWIDELGEWVHYDGKRWSLERGSIEAQRLAHEVIEHIDAEAMALGDLVKGKNAGLAVKERLGDWATPDIVEERIKTLRGHAVRSGSAGMTAGMQRQARSFLSCRLEDFDRDPLAYNLLNGTLRFVSPTAEGKPWTVKVDPHDPADMIMQIAGVAYDDKAQCPFWIDRLALLTPDAEQLAALKPLYGYTLTGLTSDQSFYVHQGKGGDGKSASHMALADLHGDYYRHANVKTFLQASGQRGGAEHRSDLVRLRGDIRFVTCDEPPPNSTWDGETIKQITGSMITARGANERHEITYRPRFKLHPECNRLPRAPSDDKGFRRRFKLFMWKVSLADTKAGEMPIDQVLAQLEVEKSGILNWLVEGALEWLTTRKIPQPQAMAEVLTDFWAQSSPMLEWMGEWCDTTDPDAVTLTKGLLDHYKDWAETRGIDVSKTNITSFGRALTDKQIEGKKGTKGERLRKGIKLRLEGLFTPTAQAPPDTRHSAASTPPAGSSPPSAGSQRQPAVPEPPPLDPDDPGMQP